MYRKRHCLQTLFWLLKFVMSETKEPFFSRTNALLVGTLISIGDVSVSIVNSLLVGHLWDRTKCPSKSDVK